MKVRGLCKKWGCGGAKKFIFKTADSCSRASELRNLSMTHTSDVRDLL